MHYRCICKRYPKIIFNFVPLVKNNFRRLPRRAFGTARNDDKSFRLPEILCKQKTAKNAVFLSAIKQLAFGELFCTAGFA
ncbi:MAG: hypothetical protein IJV35_03525 [Neisseriaceae bacterium]|nr:hypothetical protein [Neisseriaceae bacterium]